MKIRFTELPVGSCFLDTKGDMKKKVADTKMAVVLGSGKVSTRKVKKDPEVDPSPCELRYLGVGLRRHPDLVVEIGDGNTIKGRRKS